MDLFLTILIGFLSYGLFYYFADKKDKSKNKKEMNIVHFFFIF
jgi:hypothetical protein